MCKDDPSISVYRRSLTFLYYEFSPLILLSFSKFRLSYTADEKNISSYHAVALCCPNQHFRLCAISTKILTCVRTVVFVCLLVSATLFQQETFSSIITLRPLVLAAVICPTYHPTRALYIYLVSRAVQVSPELFYVFSMPGKLRETTRIVCKK